MSASAPFDLYEKLMALRLTAAEFADEAADNSTGAPSTLESEERGRASAFAEAAALLKTFIDARQPLGMFESPDDAPESPGRFANWSDADCAAQCQMQSAEVVDPELSAFWLHLSRRLLELSDPGGRDQP